MPQLPARGKHTLAAFSSSLNFCKDSLVNQSSGPAPIPSSVSTLAAVWLIVFTLVLHVVGFVWTTSMIVAVGLAALFLASFLVVRTVHHRRSSPGAKT